MKTIGFVALLLTSTSAFAECTNLAPGLYQCEPPPQVTGPVRCRYFNETLICNGEIGQEKEVYKQIVKPVNCAWRRNKYVCWGN